MKISRMWLFFCLSILLASNCANAQNGYQYFTLSGGYYFVPSGSWSATIGLEFAGRNRNQFEFAGEVYQNRDGTHKNYALNGIYKPLISKSKNSSLYFRLGAGVGTNEKRFIGPLQTGFEFSQAFGHGWELMIQQKNYFIFWDRQKWRTGISLGVKIPII